MGKSWFETIMGALVLLVAGGFMAFAYQSSNLKPVEGYSLKAKFNTVAGVGLGTDVRIGGIKIGVISDMVLDPSNYKAIISFQIKNGIKIPADSSASVVSDGLLGSKYVKIEPGADDKMLANNGEIPYTQSAVNLEELIGKMVFSGGGVDKNSGKKDNSAVNAPDMSTSATPGMTTTNPAAPPAADNAKP
jgi:phospholipid/cholesterol/gamma-HCH transport system substrate-binding protein